MATSDTSTILEALEAAYSWQNSPSIRTKALEFLEQFKSGSLQAVGNVAQALAGAGGSSVARAYGYQVLQHLVRFRWTEFSTQERQTFAQLAFKLLNEVASAGEEWAIRSKAASLFADVVKQEGASLWLDVLPSLISGSSAGPNHAEIVALVLQFVAEDVTVHNEGLEGEKRRALLAALSKGLPQVLPFLAKVLEHYLQAAVLELQKGNIELARKYAAVVSSALGAEKAHVEWAPVGEIAASGVIDLCSHILQIPEFRVDVCDVLSMLAGRRRSPEDASAFDAAMVRVFNVISTASSSVLGSIRNGGGPVDIEFGEGLCKVFVAMTPTNATRIVWGSEERLTRFLEQILGFFQHPDPGIQGHATTICVAIAREGHAPHLDSAKLDVLEGTERSVNEKKASKKADAPDESVTIQVPEDFWTAVVDVLAERISKAHIQSEDDSDLGDALQYRAKLIELLRLITAQHPLLVVRRVIPGIVAAITTTLQGNAKVVEELEGLHLVLDSILPCVPHAVMTAIVASRTQSSTISAEYEMGRLMEELAMKVVSMELVSPLQLEQQAHLVAALGPYLKHSTQATPLALSKLFSLFTSIPQKEETDGELSRARHGICMSIIRLSKAAGEALAPHLEAIAGQLQSMREKNYMRHNEFNHVAESLLIIATSSGSQQLPSVADWLLSPFKPEWIGTRVTDPAALASSLGNSEIWKTFHTVTLFSKVAQRATSEVLFQHLDWILPPLLQLLDCVHRIWSPSIRSTLHPSVEAALQMGSQDIASLIGNARGKVRETVSEDSGEITSKRTWLKGVRDSGYSILSYAAAKGKHIFLDRHAISTCTMLLGNLQWMHPRHIKLMIHTVVVPLVKATQPEHWESFLGMFLHQLLGYCQIELDSMWHKLQQNSGSDSSGSVLIKEMVEDKILREMTREVCALLVLLPWHPPKPDGTTDSTEPETGGVHTGKAHENRIQHVSLLSYMLQKPELGKPILLLGRSAITWPDSDTTHKGVTFCLEVVRQPVLTHPSANDVREFVCRDMLQAAMYSLTLTSSAQDQADILGLIRDIYVRLGPFTSTPREVFLQIPGVSEGDVVQLEAWLKSTGSAREQRGFVKQFLLHTVKVGRLKALVNAGSRSVIANLSARRDKERVAEQGTPEKGPIGLASLGV